MNGAGRQDGPLRPDYGPGWADLRCDTCGATWTGQIDDPCEWCQRSLERLIVDSRTQLLRPAWLDVDRGPRYDELGPDDQLVWDRTRGHVHGAGSAVTWAARLRRGIHAGLLTETEAVNALRRCGVDAA